MGGPDLRDLYEEALGVRGVGEHDSFFACGGSSLLVAVLLEAVQERCGVSLGLEEFFAAPTLAGLREAVARRAGPPAAGDGDLVGMLEQAAAAGAPERPAVIGPDGSVSYAQLLERCAQAARAGRADSTGFSPLRLASTAAGAADVLARIAAREPFLLLAPGASAAEERLACEALAAERGRGDDDAARDGYAIVTSGSTGRPKVVLVPFAGMLALRPAQAGVYGLSPADAMLVMAPLHWGYGLQSGLVLAVVSGATAVLPTTPLSPAGLRQAATGAALTVTMGVSFAYRLLLAADLALPALRLAVVGGDPLPGDVARDWRERTGVALSDGYGTSETDHVAVNAEGLAGSVGRPLPGVSVRVRDANGGLAETGKGELLVRSPALARGYAGDEEQSRRRFRDGWFHTGDSAELRPDGHIVLRGRLDDQLNAAGAKVDPREVEAACREGVDGLRDCAVVGVRRPAGHVEVCAYVVADRPVSRIDLRAALEPRLSPHKIPTRVVQLPELPRTPSGKLLHEELPA